VAIWAWALEVYGRPGVSETCLELQDVHGQNTSLLLWAVHAATDDADLLTRGAEAARAWDRVVLTSLRAARRELKPSLPPFAESARQALREEIKGVELAAERLLLETLARLGETRGGVTALAALTAASKAWGNPAPIQPLAALAAALE
jgi:uncharacterized protein (TIGR02444 family)